MLRPAAVFILATCLAAPLAARERIAGPVPALVEKVIDGDTLLVRAAVWPGHSVRVSVRLRGIDAPEMKAPCAAEREAAARARAALGRLVASGSVIISDVSGDKYFGRVLADVATADGLPVARELLALGVVRPYRGGRRATACR